MSAVPEVRGRLTCERMLADLTWLRVGGPAEFLFQPFDLDDLVSFLSQLERAFRVFPLGVGSNLIVRDGGVRGVVIRLGRGFNQIEKLDDTRLRVGAGALDGHVALRAGQWGIDLNFLRTIPGSIGGAVAMNAGCYGMYMADILCEVALVTRAGQIERVTQGALGLGYRSSKLATGSVVVEAILQGKRAEPEVLAAQMEDQIAQRNATQPVKERTAGSTFRNPSGFSSTGRPDDPMGDKAWSLIEAAGMRGARLGGAAISEKHANFLVNTGRASAADLENLGEEVIKRVFEQAKIRLEWEIQRVGEPVPNKKQE